MHGVKPWSGEHFRIMRPYMVELAHAGQVEEAVAADDPGDAPEQHPEHDATREHRRGPPRARRPLTLPLGQAFGNAGRNSIVPFWLCNNISLYPTTLNLKTHLHLRGGNKRPSIELEPTDHPLAIDQRQGISIKRVEEIATALSIRH